MPLRRCRAGHCYGKRASLYRRIGSISGLSPALPSEYRRTRRYPHEARTVRPRGARSHHADLAAVAVDRDEHGRPESVLRHCVRVKWHLGAPNESAAHLTRGLRCRERSGRSPRSARRFSAGPPNGPRSGPVACWAAGTDVVSSHECDPSQMMPNINWHIETRRSMPSWVKLKPTLYWALWSRHLGRPACRAILRKRSETRLSLRESSRGHTRAIQDWSVS